MSFFLNTFSYISIFSLTALIFVGLPLEFVKTYSVIETGIILSSFYVGTMISPFFFYRVIIGYTTTRIAIIMNITALSTLFISMDLKNGLYLSMVSLFLLGIGKNVILTYYDSKVISTNYNLYRGVGSIAFVLTALGVGLHYIHISLLGIIISVIFFINYFTTVYSKGENLIIASRNFFSIDIIKESKYFWSSIFFHRMGMGVFLSFAGIFIVYHLGYTELDFSILWIFAATLEGICLFFYRKIVSINTFITVALIATVIRFLLIYLYPEYFPVLMISQALHMFSYAIYHLNILEIINTTFKEKTPINIKIYHSISEGLSLFLGSLLGIMISNDNDFFLILSCFSLISLILFKLSIYKKEITIERS